MKTHTTKIILLSLTVLVACGALIVSCNKQIEQSEQLTPLKPTNLDVNAGTWKPVLLTSNSQIAVAAPSATTSPEYLKEISDIKTLQASLTDDQKKSINYWSGGGVLRWNELLRELVARYNLPPAPNADDTYTIPDSNNPFNYPEFPFSNPPYAARSYAYVSAAQFDALKAAWYYKYLYNRPSPSKVDNSIQALMPSTDLPSYPSEDAVISATSEVMLKLLFPAAVSEITQRASEERKAAVWSGRATASDTAAGKALGVAVAQIFVTRAKGDGMKNAIGTAPLWQGLIDGATAKGEIPWLSRDLPARPPMLPFFGNVKGLIMTPAQIVSERPAGPPSTSSDEMKQQVAEVKSYAKNLTRDRHAIVLKWADGVATSTPPGHWNQIAAEYIIKADYSEVRAARAFALLNMGLFDAAIGCWNTKYYYFNPRPCQLDNSIKTATGVPNFPSYVSGHSTFSGSAATVLSYLFPEQADYFSGQATEASYSRLYAAIHYRVDVEEGLTFGQRIGGYTVQWAQGDGAN